jgi:RimJ/RimL family protein N-acetyltransferase
MAPDARKPGGEAPVLETERLRLRGHRLVDFGECAAIWADPVVTRYITGKPSTAEEVWARLLRYVGHWALLGFGFWAIEEKHSGRLIGEVGFADFKRDLQPSLNGAPEMGWVLAPQTHGKGYATEAVRAAVAWGEAHFGPVRTVCLISPENTASLRVAEKNGFREFARTTYKGEATILLSRGPL